MDKVLMVKDNMVHYVPYELVNDFLSYGWEKADLTEKKIQKFFGRLNLLGLPIRLISVDERKQKNLCKKRNKKAN